MKEHILVDITAAMEYAKKQIQEHAEQEAKKHKDEYNSTHKRQIKEATVEESTVNFEGLNFGFAFDVNNYKGCDAGNFIVPIDDFIVNNKEKCMKVKELVTYPYFVCRKDTQENEYVYYGFSFQEDAEQFMDLDYARMNYNYPIHEPRYVYDYVDGDEELKANECSCSCS